MDTGIHVGNSEEGVASPKNMVDAINSLLSKAHGCNTSEIVLIKALEVLQKTSSIENIVIRDCYFRNKEED